jgi:hypothetical protein
MAIPYFFFPERIEGYPVFDGGIQNNYPVTALMRHDPDLKDRMDFVGFYLGAKNDVNYRSLNFLDLLSIASEAGDQEDLKTFIDRTVVIDPRPIKTTDFSLSEIEIDFLLAEGRASALQWLHYWTDQKPPLSDVSAAVELAEGYRKKCIEKRFRRLVVKFALIVAIVGGLSSCLVPFSATIPLRTNSLFNWNPVAIGPSWYTQRLDDAQLNDPGDRNQYVQSYELKFKPNSRLVPYTVEFRLPNGCETGCRIYFGYKKDGELPQFGLAKSPSDTLLLSAYLPGNIDESYFTVELTKPVHEPANSGGPSEVKKNVRIRANFLTWLRLGSIDVLLRRKFDE